MVSLNVHLRPGRVVVVQCYVGRECIFDRIYLDVEVSPLVPARLHASFDKWLAGRAVIDSVLYRALPNFFAEC